MAITIALYLVGVVMAYLAYEMAMTPPLNSKAKNRWRIGIAICALIGIGLTIYQCNDAQRKETAFNSRIEGLRTNINQSLEKEKKELSAQISVVTNQLNIVNSLRQKYESLVDRVLTNTSINTETRQSIIDADRTNFEVLNSQLNDANAWEEKLRGRLRDDRAALQIKNEKALAAEQLYYEKCCFYYNYTIPIFTEKLKEIAKKRGEIVISSFHGVPTSVSPDIGVTNLGEIKFQTNTNWSFQIKIRDKSGGQRRLVIEDGDNHLEISPWLDNLNTHLHLPTGEWISIEKPAAEYKETINSALEDLIGAVLIAIDNKHSNPTNK